MSTTKCYDIVAGPNKDAIFDACKYAHSKTVNFSFDFSVAAGYTLPNKNAPSCAYFPMDIADMTINGIEHEDGSGESFNLYGFCRANLDPSRGTPATRLPYEFEAYYNTKTRKGTIKFENQ